MIGSHANSLHWRTADVVSSPPREERVQTGT
jgi:hypothetical protein